MRKILMGSIQFAIIMVLLVGGALTAARQERRTTRLAVGEKGDVTITTETKIADITLKPGRYYLEPRVEGTVAPRTVTAHYIHFTQVTPEEHLGRQAARNSISGNAVAHPGEIECKLEALAKEASKAANFTTTEDGIPRITRVEIPGEAVAHIF